MQDPFLSLCAERFELFQRLTAYCVKHGYQSLARATGENLARLSRFV
jgi:hypothetical protein